MQREGSAVVERPIKQTRGDVTVWRGDLNPLATMQIAARWLASAPPRQSFQREAQGSSRRRGEGKAVTPPALEADRTVPHSERTAE